MDPCFSVRAYNSSFYAGLNKIRSFPTRCWRLPDNTHVVEIGGKSMRFDGDGYQIPGSIPAVEDRQEIQTIPINILRNLNQIHNKTEERLAESFLPS